MVNYQQKSKSPWVEITFRWQFPLLFASFLYDIHTGRWELQYKKSSISTQKPGTISKMVYDLMIHIYSTFYSL